MMRSDMFLSSKAHYRVSNHDYDELGTPGVVHYSPKLPKSSLTNQLPYSLPYNLVIIQWVSHDWKFKSQTKWDIYQYI